VNGLGVQKLEVVTTFDIFKASFKCAAEMAKELDAAPMGADVEAEALSALHGIKSVLERQVEAMEDKFILLHLESRRCIAELREKSFSGKKFNTVVNGRDGNCGAMRLFDECNYQHIRAIVSSIENGNSVSTPSRGFTLNFKQRSLGHSRSDAEMTPVSLVPSGLFSKRKELC
jgi:hypothetical protein